MDTWLRSVGDRQRQSGFAGRTIQEELNKKFWERKEGYEVGEYEEQVRGDMAWEEPED